MAGKAALTEDDDAPATGADAAAVEQEQPREHEKTPEGEIEVVDAPADGEGEEPRLTDTESGERPVIEQPGEERGKRWPSKKERREKQKRAAEAKDQRIQALDQRNRELQDQINSLSGGVGQLLDGQAKERVAQLRRELTSTEQKFNETEARIVALAESGDFKGAEVLRREAYACVVRGQQLQGTINQLERPRPQAPAQQDDSPALSPQARKLGKAFMDKHSDWYGEDPEATEVVNAIDKRVTADGFDPGTPEYWEEVETRAAKRLPEYFEEDQPRQRQNGARPNGERRGPMTGAQGGGAQPGVQKVYLTKGRKDAMIQTGTIDESGRVLDRKKFDRQMAKFKEHDALNGAAR